MTTRKTILLGFMSAAWMLALQGVSAAQQCKTTADCPKGSSCQELTVTTVASSGGPVDAGVPVCPKDQPNCAGGAGGGAGASSPTKTATPPPTTTATELVCQPIACKVDADCGSGMVCFAQTGTACSGSASAQPACPPNQVCPPAPDPAPPVCTTTTTTTCAFKWQLPCQVDADCGDGAFTCQPSVSITCSGGTSGGSAGSSGGTGTGTGISSGGGKTSGVGTVSSVGSTTTGAGGASASTPASKPTNGENPAVIAVPPSPPDSTPPVCTTTTSLPGYCQLKNSTCTTDADCPADWTCASVPDATPISAGASASASSGPAVAVAVAPVPTPGPATGTTASKVCSSPASFGFKGVPGVSGSGTGSASSAPGTVQSGSTGTGNAGMAADGNTPTTPPTASGPVRSDSGSTTGTAAGGASASSNTAETGASAPKSSGGCAVGGGARDDRAGLGLGVLGLALVLGMRRRTR